MPSGSEKIFVAKANHKRLDIYLSQITSEFSRSQLSKMAREGLILINSAPSKPSSQIREGDEITLQIPKLIESNLEIDNQSIEIIYEDQDVLVLNKPPHLPVHPGPGHYSKTLVNRLLAHSDKLSSIGGVVRPGIIHRLDKDTSGIIVIAKNDNSHRSLSLQFQERTISKIYSALVWGIPILNKKTITSAIGRDPNNRKRMAVLESGKKAESAYLIKEIIGDFSLLDVTPKTGRTHQIRVHLKSIGHPIVGDMLYSSKKIPSLERQFLHASYIKILLPSRKKEMEFIAPLAKDLSEFLTLIRTNNNN
jgi:23S rRNA pseudouridine1911/1915/1917 synthase